jgi:outer membrane PBP1 activator LpoA protein
MIKFFSAIRNQKQASRGYLLLNCLVVLATACHTQPNTASFDYGTQNEAARTYFFKGFEEILDNGRWTASEAAFRKAVELDPDWMLGKSLVGRITQNLEERQELLKEIELKKEQTGEYERLLLDVNIRSLKAANNRDQGIKNSEKFVKSRNQLAERNFGRISRKFPKDNYFKAEYIEYLHHNYGAQVALDSLNAMATNAQMKLGFYISYSATLALELGNMEKALSLSSVLDETLNDPSFTSPLLLKAQVYLAQDSLLKAKEYVDKVVQMDSNHLIAIGLQGTVNRRLENNK